MTGGSNGLLLAPPELFGMTFDTDVKMFYLTLAFAAASVLGQ